MGELPPEVGMVVALEDFFGNDSVLVNGRHLPR
jgi:hypothetical protein